MVFSSEHKIGGTALIQILFCMDLIKKSDFSTFKRNDIQQSFSNAIKWLKQKSQKEKKKEDQIKKRLYHEFISAETDLNKLSQLFKINWDDKISNNKTTNFDSKRKLQEYLQKKHRNLPEYKFFKINKRFKSICICNIENNTYVTRAKGNSKKEASRVAANLMLIKLNLN